MKNDFSFNEMGGWKWVKKAQRSKPKIGKPCLFDSYQNIY